MRILGKTMYYDRHVEQDVLDLILPGGPLEWLVGWVKGRDGSRLDFRRNLNERKRGAFQVYLGRTSPLEVIGRRGGRFKLTADPAYEAAFFRSHTVEGLAALRREIHSHLDGIPVNNAFIDGEAVSHNGLMRRYGLGFRIDDPLVAVDSELRVGFKSDPEVPGTGTDHRRAFDARVRSAIVLERGGIPRKLDTIGVLPSGDIALVEVKKAGGDLLRALEQAAVHVHRFSEVMAQVDFVRVLRLMIAQKVDAGLLPQAAVGRLADEPRLVPVVAAPGLDLELNGSHAAYVASTPQLADLHLWRLTEDGVVEAHRP